MAWQVPWFILWLVSWANPHNSPPPLLSNGAVLDIPTPKDVHDCDTGRCYNISVVNRCVDPDSSVVRSGVLAAEGSTEPTLPGPIISGNKGDRFLINVTNGLTDKSMFTGTTIHWHGIHQNHSRQMDGSAGVSQCVIAPGESFLYNFTGQDQVGTFWYHSHYAVQYCDGLRGAFVIRDPKDPYGGMYDIDNDDTIISLMDWYHYPSPVTPRQIWPDSVLINGIGCYSNDTKSCPKWPATVTVEHGKRYRFRLLNMACKSFFNFSIDGHELTVIEVDGTYIEPYNVTSMNIFPAQRYSFVLNATQTPCNYTIHSTLAPTEHNNSTDTAILMYLNQDDPKKCVELHQPESGPLNEACLSSLDIDPRLLADPDLDYTVKMSKSNGTFNFLINDTQYEPPTVPILLQIMSGWPPNGLEPNKSLISLDKNKVVQIIFNIDAAGRPHPFHLHGHHFAVIKSADGPCPGPKPKHPILRDTVDTALTKETNNVTIRFITDNAGPWFLHCHNEWHLWTGMAIVFIEDYETIKADQRYIDEMKKTCAKEQQEYFPLPPKKEQGGAYTPPTPVTCTPTPLN